MNRLGLTLSLLKMIEKIYFFAFLLELYKID